MSSIKEIPPQKQFLRPQDVALIYSINVRTIHLWTSNGTLPPPRRITKKFIGWERSVLDNFFFNQNT